MNIIKQIAVSFFMLISLSSVAFAEEPAKSSTLSVNETIEHVEKALIEIKSSDFSAANLHLKAARAAAENITGNEAIVKQANNSVIQGQIESKKGDIAKSSALLNKGLELYRSL